MKKNSELRIVFFGGEPLGTATLDALFEASLIPTLVVCNPDRPHGRKMLLTPPPVKVWAAEHNIEVYQPTTLKSADTIERLQKTESDLFVVVAYNKIIPKEILDIPTHGVLNVHPSLLPQLRGPSPIRTAILEDKRETGVSVMLLDEEMDHGPILAQEKLRTAATQWPVRGCELDRTLATLGGAVLAETIPKWVHSTITPQEQDHSKATYTKKITKEMGKLSIDPYNMPTGDTAYQTLLKIRAFDGWPGTFFFMERNGKKIRVKITDAELASDGSLNILLVIPEGKKEILFSQLLS